MKRQIALFLSLASLLSFPSCSSLPREETTQEVMSTLEETEEKPEAKTEEETLPDTEGMTVGQILLAEFRKDPSGAALDVAERMANHPIIPFRSVFVPVEEGYLGGFDNFEVTGFEEGATFGPMISAIPFVGYIFTLPEDADIESFKKDLSENANLRWAISVEAEEMVVESEGNKVFFVMCKREFK